MARARIARELRGRAVPIDSVQPHPANPRAGDVPAIIASLREHGQRLPLLVQDSTGFIVAGNHRWKAMRELGWGEVAVIRMDLTDDQAARYMAADNRTSDLGRYDDQILAGLLAELAAADRLPATGFTDADVEALRVATAPPTGPSGRKPSATYTDLLAGYERADVRGVLLDYPLGRFRWVADSLAGLAKGYGVKSNAEAVIRLLEQATGETAPDAS